MKICEFAKATGKSLGEIRAMFNYPNREEYIDRLREKTEVDWCHTLEELKESVEAEWLCRCLIELGRYRKALETGNLRWEHEPERNEVEARLNRVKGEKFGSRN